MATTGTSDAGNGKWVKENVTHFRKPWIARKQSPAKPYLTLAYFWSLAPSRVSPTYRSPTESIASA